MDSATNNEIQNTKATYRQTDTEEIVQQEAVYTNENTVQNPNNDATKNLLLAGLSIFAPGAAAGILAGEAIKDSGVLESEEFKSFAQTANKTAVTAYVPKLQIKPQ